MIAGKNESKIILKTNHANININLVVQKCNSNQKWNNDKYRCECKMYHICGNDSVWNPSICIYENGQYLASIIHDSVIMCYEIIDPEKIETVPKNFNETQNFYILLAVLLITMALLTAVSNYCYLIIYRAKEKHLLPFHVNNLKLREFLC